jgi:hypothetical protein
MERIWPGKDVMRSPVAPIVEAVETIDLSSRGIAKRPSSVNSQLNVGVCHPLVTSTPTEKEERACTKPATTPAEARRSANARRLVSAPVLARPGVEPFEDGRAARTSPAVGSRRDQPRVARAASRIRTAAQAAVNVEVPAVTTELRLLVDQLLTDDIPSTSNQNGVATTS